VRTNAFDHAGAEVLFNAFQGAGWDDLECLRLKLQAMGPVRDPPAVPSMYSPGVMVAAVPTTVPDPDAHDLDPKTQKPVSSLWNVTRSLRRSGVPGMRTGGR